MKSSKSLFTIASTSNSKYLKISLASLPQRFRAKFTKGSVEQCWDWTGKRNPKGYGVIKVNNTEWYAHRVSFELTNGPIPDGLLACHTCDRPRCVNPHHLFAGTSLDNTTDMIAKGRMVTNPMRGEQQGNALLTDNLVRHIRKSRLLGETCKSIGARLGVNHRTISYAATGTSWSHVEGAIPKQARYKKQAGTDTSNLYQHQSLPVTNNVTNISL
jgi:hypothetical protein